MNIPYIIIHFDRKAENGQIDQYQHCPCGEPEDIIQQLRAHIYSYLTNIHYQQSHLGGEDVLVDGDIEALGVIPSSIKIKRINS